MTSPLDNPFRSLRGDGDVAPPWMWKLAGMLAGMLGATLVREVIDRSRARFAGRRGADPGNRQESWVSALAWAGVVGVAGSVGRLLAQRAVASRWRGRAALATG